MIGDGMGYLYEWVLLGAVDNNGSGNLLMDINIFKEIKFVLCAGINNNTDSSWYMGETSIPIYLLNTNRHVMVSVYHSMNAYTLSCDVTLPTTKSFNVNTSERKGFVKSILYVFGR